MNQIIEKTPKPVTAPGPMSRHHEAVVVLDWPISVHYNWQNGNAINSSRPGPWTRDWVGVDPGVGSF